MYNFNVSEEHLRLLSGEGYIKIRVFHPKFSYLDSYGKYFDPYYPFVITDLNGKIIGKCNSEQLVSLLDEPLYKKFIYNISASDAEYFLNKNTLVVKFHKILNFKFYKINKEFKKYLLEIGRIKKNSLYERFLAFLGIKIK
jgi:hypothetical protein